ncbi:MAG: isochorismatase family protein [Chloroflexi bacterium]|nr:MAG: isochorismatase family protein [Chloroflexota bacterium]
MTQIWDDLLSEQDKAVIEAAGYDKRGASSFSSRGFGKRPALLIIDMQRFIVGDDVPILDAIAKEPIAMGAVAWRAMEHIQPFVMTCREAGLPVMYTRIIPTGHTPDDAKLAIIDALRPHTNDIVLDKNYPSAFYGTPLLTHLVQRHIDTVIIVGNSTSGCVRATAVDARQMGFNVVIPHECVFDRIEASHKINLLDLWMKYAEVMSTEGVVQYIQQAGEQRAVPLQNKTM